MSKLNLKCLFVFYVLFLSLVAGNVAADGIGQADRAAVKTGGAKVLPELDSRLPPVLPGQEVSVGGKKMKVWSTSGSLTAEGQVPHPNAVPGEWTSNSGNPDDISVILDGRDLVPNRGRPHR